jgi:hypothetical protein
MSPSSSGLHVSPARNQHEAGSKHSFIVVCHLAYSSTLNLEAKCSSKTSFDFHQTTWHYIPEDIFLQKFM